MEIKTKYNIGDRVYFMHNNKVDSMRINGIRIRVKSSPNSIHRELITTIVYLIGGSESMYFKKYLFSSKEELISSL